MPPPIHGVTYVNSLIVNNFKNNNHELELIKISYDNDISNIGKVKLSKFKVYGKILFRYTLKIITKKYDAIYCSITPVGKGFIRDAVYIFIARLFNKKIILHLHGLGIQNELNKDFKSSIYKSVFKNTYVITLSKSIIDDLGWIKNIVRKVFIVNNGIPVQREQISKKSKTDAFVITCLSTISPLKGQLTLMKAIQVLRNRGYNSLICHIAGQVSNQEYFKTLQEYRCSNNLSETIIFDGLIMGENKNELLRNSDVFVFPTEWESFGLVILEAFNNQLPVIATNVGSIPEIIDNTKNGFIFNKGDYMDIAGKIEFLINNEEIRLNMGLNGYAKLCQKYSLDSFINNLGLVFDEIFA